LYNLIKANISTSKAKARAVVSYHFDKEKDENYLTRHLVIMENEHVHDASYEVSNKPNVVYFTTLKELFSVFGKTLDSTMKQEMIQEFIIMVNAAERINNGIFTIHDGDVYNKQLDFIEETLHQFGFVEIY
jgi:hypothetical protein